MSFLHRPLCCSFRPLHLQTSTRNASIKAGVARGLRASGVEPSSRREEKRRTKPRRGPNTGALGQQNSFSRRGSARSSTDRSLPRRSSYDDARKPRLDTSFTRRPSASVGQANGGRNSSLDQQSAKRSSTRGDEQYDSRSQRVLSSGSLSRQRPFDRQRSDQSPAARSSPRRISSNDYQSLKPRHTTISSSHTPHPFPIPYTTATSAFVPGRRSAEAILLAARRQVYKLYVSSGSRSSTSVRQLESVAKKRRCETKVVEQEYIDRILNNLKMGLVVNDGVLLECSDLEYTPVNGLGRWNPERHSFEVHESNSRRAQRIETDASGAVWRPPLLLWMHEVVNTSNIAALYRSAIYFGVDGVLLTERGTGRIQSSSLRASAGAVEFLPTIAVADPKAFMAQSKEAGWRFLGAMPPARKGESSKVDVMSMGRTVMVGEDARPSVLVLGNEDQGLSTDIREKCDVAITVPAAGERAAKAGVDSLNVGVAGTMLFAMLLKRPDFGRVMSSETLGSGRMF